MLELLIKYNVCQIQVVSGALDAPWISGESRSDGERGCISECLAFTLQMYE